MEVVMNYLLCLFFNILLNSYSFFALYANIYGFVYKGAPLAISERTEMDRWIISRLNTTVKLTDEYMEEYEPTRAAREIEHRSEERRVGKECMERGSGVAEKKNEASEDRGVQS